MDGRTEREGFMRKSVAFLTAGVLLVLAFSFSGAVAAPTTACLVTGSVQLVDRADQTAPFTTLPLNDAPRLGAYDFIDTNIICNGAFSGTYSVIARGTSTGLTSSAGETCSDGKNDAATGIWTNTLTATKQAGSGSGPSTMNGTVTFTRRETYVHVIGTLDNPATPANPDFPYTADLNFTPGTRLLNTVPQPDPAQAAGCAPVVTGGVTTAALDGIALIG